MEHRPRMLIGSARQVGRRLGWGADLATLLSGRAVREAEPEALALERALADLRAKMAASGTAEVDQVSIAVSHDGAGARRGVTVTVSALARPAAAEG